MASPILAVAVTRPPSGVSLTPANAAVASNSAYAAANQSADLVGLLGSSGLVASDSGGLNKVQAALSSTGSLTNILQKIPFGPDTFPCQVAGTVTISGDLANPLTLTAGDTINVVSANCDDGLGEVVDGTLAFTVDSFAGDLLAGAYELTMSMLLSNFQVTTAGDVLTSNGDVAATLDTFAAPLVSAAVSGASLTIDSNSGSETLSNYSSAQTVDAGLQPSPYTLDSSGMLDSSALSGTVTYSTPVTFQGFDTNFPNSGELLISGDNSSARLIAVDDVNVRIEIDTDGNGTVDETIDTTWADLTS